MQNDVVVNSNTAEPIAIIGVGCRFPGGVTDPDSFWQLLCNQVDAVTEIPPDRIDLDQYYDARPATPGKMMTRWGGFLDHIDRFDARFFGISPHEAERMDPQQRLLLEVAWESLEDAGQVTSRLAGGQTGVFVGLWLNDYEARLFANPAQTDFYMTTGSGRYSASGRLSYAFGFQGPSLTIDTACSSSLVAVHLACQSLRSGECSLALAGGANVILQPHISIAYSQSQMMAPDGHCKFGDAAADGYVRSEGAGMVVLKPLAQAQADGDPIYAVILGSAVNNDGRSSGYLATPGRQGQADMLRRAYQNAGVEPQRVQYVEAHGTGTRAGDPVELEALGEVLGVDRPAGQPCAVGSVKTNFGHTEGAAGVAGLIKVALMFKHRAIPASLHMRQLNPNIPWSQLKLTIPTQLTSLPTTEPALAGVSSFGIAGTNAHVVLTEAPAPETAATPPAQFEPAHLLLLSARTTPALAAMARTWAGFLTAIPSSLADICYTAARRRAHHEYRLALVGHTHQDLAERLAAFAQGDTPPGVSSGQADLDYQPGLVFVFPGQGSQWLGMGRELLAKEPVFKAALEQCAQAIESYVDWSLLEQLNAGPEQSRFEEIDVIQPTLFALQVALAALWRSWGVEPDAVIGHSMGEVAAAHVAGALSLDAAARVICRRSRLLRRVSGQGVMAVVGLPLAQAQAALAGFEDQISIAVSNSPRSTVLSGDPAAMEAVLATLQAGNIFCRLIKVDVASHSPQMDPLRNDLLGLLEGLQPQTAAIPIYSTVTGQVVDGSDFDAHYWARNLRHPVLFSKMVQRLLEDERAIFVELSAHPILLPAIEETLHHLDRSGHVIPSLQREKPEAITLRNSLAALYTLGYPLDWPKLFPVGGRHVPLPRYPWQRQRFWLDVKPPAGNNGWSRLFQLEGSEPAHPLLGVRLPQLAHLPKNYIWQNKLDSRFRRAVAEQDLTNPVVAMALAAAAVVFGKKSHTITELVSHKPLPLTATSAVTLQFILAVEDDEPASFQLFGQTADSPATAGQAIWEPYAAGKITRGQADAAWFYNLEWQPRPRPETPALPKDVAGSWLIFSDRGVTGSEMAAQLEARGADCFTVFPGKIFDVSGRSFRVNPARPQDFAQLFTRISEQSEQPLRGVIHLWSLDMPAAEGLNPASLQKTQVDGLAGALHLLQTLAQHQTEQSPRLWLVTRAAQPVDSDSPLAVTQAPLWGFGRVAALEYPYLWGGLIDLPPSSSPAEPGVREADACLAEILAPGTEPQLVFRHHQRYVARLVKSQPAQSVATPLRISPDAVYLITGGLGSLGIAAARWLIEQGARQVVLTSRTGLPDRAEWAALPADDARRQRVEAVQTLEALGAEVSVVKADVADPAQMSALLAQLKAAGNPLRGVIHAAGVAGPHRLRDMPAAALEATLRAKMTGAWLLHQLTETSPLDFFVLYSSGAAIWGSQGLAHYAAANHFMDALAHYRRRLGLPALSVNWGWWAGDGLTGGSLAEFFSQIGLVGMPPEQALAALKYLLQTGATQKIVADIDWPTFKPIYEARGPQPLLAQIEVTAPTAKQAQPEAGPSFVHRLQATEPHRRRDVLLAHVRAEVARILGFEQPELMDIRQGFFKMGMDSIMTVRLRNRLELTLECSLPPTIAFEYPSVEALSAYLAQTVLNLSQPAPAEAAPQAAAVAGQAEPANLDTLAEDELLALLDSELSTIEKLTKGR